MNLYRTALKLLGQRLARVADKTIQAADGAPRQSFCEWRALTQREARTRCGQVQSELSQATDEVQPTMWGLYMNQENRA